MGVFKAPPLASYAMLEREREREREREIWKLLVLVFVVFFSSLYLHPRTMRMKDYRF